MDAAVASEAAQVSRAQNFRLVRCLAGADEEERYGSAKAEQRHPPTAVLPHKGEQADPDRDQQDHPRQPGCPIAYRK